MWAAGRSSDGLVVLYDFRLAKGGIVRDRSGAGQPLNLKIENPKNVRRSEGALEVRGPTLGDGHRDLRLGQRIGAEQRHPDRDGPCGGALRRRHDHEHRPGPGAERQRPRPARAPRRRRIHRDPDARRVSADDAEGQRGAILMN